ncbi:MAG: hypothetical protein BWX84_02561 [Verrucomicrobia bacterium ADurb.Bin118]|nr:MAG: hypothetical protein BWX84_02561 [Verrucomicrobia bacterium ADurb.Bin118]
MLCWFTVMLRKRTYCSCSSQYVEYQLLPHKVVPFVQRLTPARFNSTTGAPSSEARVA